VNDLFGRDHVQMSIELLREFEPPEGYYLAFSGGKDSVCIHAVAELAGVKFDAHYNVTTCDPPELIYFIRKHYPEVVFERSPVGQSIFTRIAKKGLPTRFGRWCCEEFKEHGGSGRRVLTGVRSQESPKRASRKQVEPCLRNKRVVYVHGIKPWTTEQVWDFIRDRGLPYCKLYDEGWTRLGCLICPFEKRKPEGMRRWPGIWALTKRRAEEFYETHERCRLQWETFEGMWAWWLDIAPRKTKQADGQFSMFFQEGEE